MARKIVNIGQQGNDGTGDSIREAFKKVNDNFHELFSVFGSGETLSFTDLGDTPLSYSDGQIFYADSSSTIKAKTLVAGTGITIDVDSSPGDIVITAETSGSADTTPELAGPLNANGLVIANVPQPDEANVQLKVDAWNTIHSPGINDWEATVDDLLITKRYADANYQPASGTGPFITRSEPADDSEYIETISGYPAGNVTIVGHGFSSTGSDNGLAYVYTGTGGSPLSSGSTYYIRYVDLNTISLHTTEQGAIDNTNQVIIVGALGTGDKLTLADYDSNLDGYWLSNEAMPRESIVRRQGDTMEGPLFLYSNPTSNMHAATKEYVDSVSISLNTDNLTEGTTNLFYTTARATTDARLAISVSNAGGDGSVAYDNSTGLLTYTGPSATEVRAHFSAGTGINILDGVVSTLQDISSTASPTFVTVNANLSGNVTGNLTGSVLTASQTSITTLGTLTGLTTTDTTGAVTVGGTLTVKENATFNKSIISDVQVMNLNGTSLLGATETNDVGVEFYWHDGVAKRGFFGLDASTGNFTYIPDATAADVNGAYSGTVGTIEANLTGDVTGTVSDLSNHTSDDLPEGTTSQYLTSANLAAILVEGSNITLTHDPVGHEIVISASNTGGYDLSANDTDDLSEGAANLYFTNARAQNAITVTDAGGDGSVTYVGGTLTYTGPSATEVRAHFTGGAGITITNGSIAVDTLPNASLENSSVTINGTAVSLGGTLTLDTDDIQEQVGATNKWYTTAEAQADARSSIYVTPDPAVTDPLSTLTYDDLTGELYFTSVDNIGVQSAFAASTGILFGLNAGVMEISTNLVAGNGVIINDNAGQLTIEVDTDQAVTGQDLQDTIGAIVDPGYTITVDGVTGLPDPFTSDAWAEGSTNLYFSSANFDTELATKTTDDIAEGATNKYFTTTNVRTAVSHVDAGGDGSFNYDSGTGVFTYTGPSATEVRAHFSEGNDITITSGSIAVDSSTSSTADAIVKRTSTGGMQGVHISPAPIAYTLSTDVTLALSSITSNIVRLNTTGAGLKFILPNPSTATGYWLVLRNLNATNSILIEDTLANSITTLANSSNVKVVCDGTDWFVV